MPFYLFQNIKTEEIREIFFHMIDEKIYNGENGKEIDLWKRIYLSPNPAINTVNIDPFSKKDYAKWVENKKLKIGDMIDRSKELSEQREAKLGIDDPVKAKMFDKYKKQTGKESPIKLREERVKKLKKLGINVNYDKG